MFALFKRGEIKEVILVAPFSGEVVELKNVPDHAFAQGMVGDGVALKPKSEYLLAPVAGEIVQIFPTNHTLGIKTAEGLEILIHIGIDTVKLKGCGFFPLVRVKQKVMPVDRLIKVDWSFVNGRVPSIITPMIVTSMGITERIDVLAKGEVQAGDDLLRVTIKN